MAMRTRSAYAITPLYSLDAGRSQCSGHGSRPVFRKNVGLIKRDRMSNHLRNSTSMHVAIKWTIPVSRQITTIRQSKVPFQLREAGSGPTKSIPMASHGSTGTGSGCNNPNGFCRDIGHQRLPPDLVTYYYFAYTAIGVLDVRTDPLHIDVRQSIRGFSLPALKLLGGSVDQVVSVCPPVLPQSAECLPAGSEGQRQTAVHWPAGAFLLPVL
ncbi:hypothetical protein FISHEDRAFT_58619 [Fistulina hepatica ATCC 64428]|uniref:Uncharacterized protein n=1 Tax=Fistulina hepatica ATCC 64428 TaxID=1128425 RepID=A0A0D7ADY7_9AGAR|nr:hypothetical protein FISHEDRAFT_58619 [Fistulina hepatica ATCC 64428]